MCWLIIGHVLVNCSFAVYLYIVVTDLLFVLQTVVDICCYLCFLLIVLRWRRFWRRVTVVDYGLITVITVVPVIVDCLRFAFCVLCVCVGVVVVVDCSVVCSDWRFGRIYVTLLLPVTLLCVVQCELFWLIRYWFPLVYVGLRSFALLTPVQLLIRSILIVRDSQLILFILLPFAFAHVCVWTYRFWLTSWFVCVAFCGRFAFALWTFAFCSILLRLRLHHAFCVYVVCVLVTFNWFDSLIVYVYFPTLYTFTLMRTFSDCCYGCCWYVTVMVVFPFAFDSVCRFCCTPFVVLRCYITLLLLMPVYLFGLDVGRLPFIYRRWHFPLPLLLPFCVLHVKARYYGFARLNVISFV